MNNILDTPEVLNHLFHPRKSSPTPLPKQALDINFSMDDGVTIGCRFFTADKEAPVILFFHGNGEIVPDYDQIGPMYNSQGINILVSDYRGYGWSEGNPTSTNMLADGHSIYRQAKDWLQKNDYTGAFFLMGRSLGSVNAIELAKAHNEDIGGLIIESGFAETMPLAITLGFDVDSTHMTEEQGFNNMTKIESVTKPTFILHGQADSLINISQAEKLHAACGARSKELQIVPGADHNSLIAVGGILYFQAIKNFINKTTGANDWRKKRREQRQEQKQEQRQKNSL